MSSKPTYSMQMPTPPMTLAELEWERRQCHGRQYQFVDERLSPAFEDWTLFPEEEQSLAESTPVSPPMERNAKTPRPQQTRAQKNGKTKQNRQYNDLKKARTTRSDKSRNSEPRNGQSTIRRNAGSKTQTSNNREITDFGSQTCQVAGFGQVPRSLERIPTFGRFPTPPVEDMGEMFAPIEALGENLRWYRETRAH